MLISVYFPQLLSEYEELRELRIKAKRLEIDVVASGQAQQGLSAFREPYLALVTRFRSSLKALKLAIREQGKSLKLLNTD